MRTEKIKVERVSLGSLIGDMEQGRLRIPRFQREFVWERKRIQTLLDSMYKEYPIGTIFLWKAPTKYNHLLRDVSDLQQPPLEKGGNYTLILDGQQRLTSLYAVIKGWTIEGEDYSKIVVDLSTDNADFQYRTPDNQRWVAIRDLLGGNHYPIYDQLSSEYRQRFISCRELLNNYPFSVVTVNEMEIDDAIEIFERINQQGRRLSRYDLIAATVLTDTFDLRERSQQDIVEKLTEFGSIAETSIPQALSLIIRGNTEHGTQLSLTPEEVEAHWETTVDCFMLAVDFVRSNLGVLRADFLPYDAMLPVLAYYFYYAQSSTVLSHEHREQLEKWFWRTTFSERYSGASQTRMSEDAKWIQNLITDGQQIDYPLSLDLNSLVNGSMAFTTSAIRNGVLCLLNLKHPLHFENGTEIQIMGEHFSKFNLAEKHHIFPVGFLRDQKNLETRQVHKIPNFCFIPQDLNRRLGDKPPSIYLSRIAEGFSDLYDFEKIMRSHLIPVGEDSGVWADDYQLFLRQRAQLILDEIKRRCGVSSLITNEVRNPAIDSIEKGLRENIHITLASLYGPDYWRDAIPSDIQKSVTDRIEEYVRKTAGTTKSMFHDPRARLDFCDVADYVKIISFKQNWSSFSAYYRSRAECEQMLRDFKDFRNAVKHNREVDSVLNHRGQAALIWFARVLNLDLADYGIY